MNPICPTFRRVSGSTCVRLQLEVEPPLTETAGWGAQLPSRHPLAQIDEELGVRYLLRGSVRRDPARARIAAQLLEASTGKQLRAEGGLGPR